MAKGNSTMNDDKTNQTPNEEPAIIVKDVVKSFKIPLDKSSGIKQLIVNFYKRKKGYREFNALNGVSFEVKKGEFFGIVGRNGSGKSTLLKTLAGIYSPDSGGVAVNGSLTPFIELGVGFNPELSGRENVFLNGALLGFSRDEMESMYDEIVEFAELSDFMEERLKNYSSGMQVRLAFSIAIRARSDILVLDEVLAVGDANFQKKCFDYFRELKDDKKTVILVSHDMEAVKRFSNRALLLEKGKVTFIGNAEEVGDEYTKRNMENGRTHEKQVSEVKQKEGPVVIKKVSLLNKNSESITNFASGEAIKIAVEYEPKGKVKEVNIGVGIHSDRGQVFGYNTKMDEIKLSTTSNSEVILEFDKLPILPGNFWLSVTCFGQDDVDMYDMKLRTLSFDVYSTGKTARYRGLVHIPHEWKV